MNTQLTSRIDALLPQTQCTRCDYADCRSYAEALAEGEADINQCPPGGEETLQALAVLLNRPAKAIDPARGGLSSPAFVARVIEADCIGCYKCVAVCPVDAIVGAPKLMHTVLSGDCNGCELCVPVCPTDCIELVPRAAELPAPAALADYWRAHYVSRGQRLAREHSRRESQSAVPALQNRACGIDIAAAVLRARLHRGAKQR